MRPLTNAEIQARKTPDQLAADRGRRAQVSHMIRLARGYELVWAGSAAELRDAANGGAVVASGSYGEMTAEARRRGLLR